MQLEHIHSQSTLSLTFLSFYAMLCFVIIDDNKISICFLILNASYIHGGSLHSLSSRNFSLFVICIFIWRPWGFILPRVSAEAICQEAS